MVSSKNRATRISDLDEKYFKEIFNLNGEVRDGHTDKETCLLRYYFR